MVIRDYLKFFANMQALSLLSLQVMRGAIVIGVGQKFRSNHNWNAVYIDSAWYLLDVTWASGSLSYFGDAFIQHFD
jgi:hypothetical protein